MIVRRIQEKHAFGVLGYRGGEEVAGEGEVQDTGGLVRPVAVSMASKGECCSGNAHLADLW